MRRIAVVDDNADNRLIIRTILEDQYEIIEFSSGAEAIEGFKREKPDVVILDISLPEMDGTEIQQRSNNTGMSLAVSWGSSPPNGYLGFDHVRRFFSTRFAASALETM